jgi:hypothetical protein
MFREMNLMKAGPYTGDSGGSVEPPFSSNNDRACTDRQQIAAKSDLVIVSKRQSSASPKLQAYFLGSPEV